MHARESFSTLPSRLHTRERHTPTASTKHFARGPVPFSFASWKPRHHSVIEVNRTVDPRQTPLANVSFIWSCRWRSRSEDLDDSLSTPKGGQRFEGGCAIKSPAQLCDPTASSRRFDPTGIHCCRLLNTGWQHGIFVSHEHEGTHGALEWAPPNQPFHDEVCRIVLPLITQAWPTWARGILIQRRRAAMSLPRTIRPAGSRAASGMLAAGFSGRRTAHSASSASSCRECRRRLGTLSLLELMPTASCAIHCKRPCARRRLRRPVADVRARAICG